MADHIANLAKTAHNHTSASDLAVVAASVGATDGTTIESQHLVATLGISAGEEGHRLGVQVVVARVAAVASAALVVLIPVVVVVAHAVVVAAAVVVVVADGVGSGVCRGIGSGGGGGVVGCVRGGIVDICGAIVAMPLLPSQEFIRKRIPEGQLQRSVRI